MFRTALWTLAAGLLVAANAAALDLRVLQHHPKMPAGFKNLWKDLARELEELRQKDLTAQSRITDLENQTRQARTRVARLEGQVATLKGRLANAERAIATAWAAAGTGPATPAGPATRPAASTLATIARRRSEVRGGYITVSGTVQNTSDQPLTSVVVKAKFLGTGGQEISAGSAYTSPRVIPPRGTASFKIVVRDNRRIRRQELTVEAR